MTEQVVRLAAVGDLHVKKTSHGLLQPLAAAVNEAGHVLGLETIAAQVESPDLLERVRAIGVDYAQGLAIAPPEPWEDAFTRLG